MQIETGKKQSKVRAVIYGPEGIGKSTLAATFPRPLFVDVEGGTHHLDIARISAPKSWSAICQIVTDVAAGRLGPEYQTLVIDTADWAEKALKEAICREAKVQALGDSDYGKLYQKLGAKWGTFLDDLSQVAETKHVVLLAHSQLSHCEIPEESGSFDRYELKLNSSFKVSTSAMTKEWASMVLFLNYEVIIVEADGKNKAQGGRRVCYTSHHACWDAKNRYGLPEKIKLNDDASIPKEIAAIFAGASAPANKQVASGSNIKQDVAKQDAQPATAQHHAPTPQPAQFATTTTPAPAPAPTPAPTPAASVPLPSLEKQKLLAQLKELMIISGIGMAELDAELARKGVVPTGTNPADYNEATLTRIINGWTAVSNNIVNHRGVKA